MNYSLTDFRKTFVPGTLLIIQHELYKYNHNLVNPATQLQDISWFPAVILEPDFVFINTKSPPSDVDAICLVRTIHQQNNVSMNYFDFCCRENQAPVFNFENGHFFHVFTVIEMIKNES
jgi:hypothetical protein